MREKTLFFMKKIIGFFAVKIFFITLLCPVSKIKFSIAEIVIRILKKDFFKYLHFDILLILEIGNG